MNYRWIDVKDLDSGAGTRVSVLSWFSERSRLGGGGGGGGGGGVTHSSRLQTLS